MIEIISIVLSPYVRRYVLSQNTRRDKSTPYRNVQHHVTIVTTSMFESNPAAASL